MGRLRDERLVLKSTVPVLEFPAAVVVPVRLPTEVTELLISDRKQNCPPILSRFSTPFSCRAWASPKTAKGVIHSPLLHQECFPLSLSSFLSLNSHPLCWRAQWGFLQRTCRARRSLTGGILIKKGNMCLGKKGEALWIQSLTGPLFGLAVRPELHGRHKHTLHWWGPSHNPKSFTVFQDPLPCQMRLPNLSASLQSSGTTTRTSRHLLWGQK